MRIKVKREVDMSGERRSSASKTRETRTNAYRSRVEKNQVKARNPWPDPFVSRKHTQVERAHKHEKVVRSSGDHSRLSRPKSDRQDKRQK